MKNTKVKQRSYSGVTTLDISEREIRNRNISRRAAEEGVVLLKNEGVLPLSTSSKIVIYGNGIAKIIKGGTGSGDVNERSVVSMTEGLAAAGYSIINKSDAEKYADDYAKSLLLWRERVLKEVEKFDGGSDMSFFDILSNTKSSELPEMRLIPEEIKAADAVLFIISRVAGEGNDRRIEEGDYYLTSSEREQLRQIAEYNQNIIGIINTGAQIEIGELQDHSAMKAMIYLSQPGMEAGHVIADIISGKVNPSGRLTTTWSRKYEDFPNALTFSHCNGDTTNERYEEGIYVGYRYFDSFGIKTLYPFGFGLSYTTFKTETVEVATEGNKIRMIVKVTNTGKNYAGKQVVQIYAACPQETRERELKKLIGFQKTSLLKPGESENVEILADAKDLAAFDERKSAWVVDKGLYGIFVSENAEDNMLAGVLRVAEDCVIEKVESIVSQKEELQEIKAPEKVVKDFTEGWQRNLENVKTVCFTPFEEKQKKCHGNEHAKEAENLANQMTDEELIAMLMGEISKGQDNIKENELVKTGIFVPGAAGETSCRFVEKYGIPAISMADGPAGLRLMRSYDVDNETGLIYGHGILSALEGGVFAPEYHRNNVTTYHMFATAIPVGTLLAQTWDTALIEEVGEMIGREMEEFGISWWLAPGMNIHRNPLCDIHRNPLCGRNFEYYSEDPVVSGKMAAAMTRGVQKIPGVGTTIKHFACNNQEDNRLHSNSILSERALREIYLRGFEIAVKTSQPMCLMTSYNLINGIPAANHTALITNVLRGEWDFQGIVMTDWTTTTAGSASACQCPESGNDLIMPGNPRDVEELSKALKEGRLDRKKAVECAARMIAVLWDTLGMEDAKPYGRILEQPSV